MAGFIANTHGLSTAQQCKKIKPKGIHE